MGVSDCTRTLRRFVLACLVSAIAGAFSMRGADLAAQIPAVKFDVRAAKGLPVSPVYEGWYEHEGKRYALFGYYNRNLQEVVDVPIGPQNQLAPGPADQGQPTRFYPGLYYGVFAIPLPSDPTAEVTWTLTANGQTLSIPTALGPLYVISPQLESGTEWPGNTPPSLRFDPAGAAVQGPFGVTVSRTASVSRPLDLDVWVSDDGQPPKRPSRESTRPLAGRRDPNGLELGWEVYRGTGAVRFAQVMPVVTQGKAHTTVTFSEPGTYMLHLTAIDSRSANRCCWTNGYVNVTVAGGAPPR